MHISKPAYWIATLLLCALMLYSAQMYFFNVEMVKGYFTHLGYPSYIVIPLAIAKVLGAIMILWRKSDWLTEWAYAGFFFDTSLAFFAHYLQKESIYLSLSGALLVLISYFLGKIVRPKSFNPSAI